MFGVGQWGAGDPRQSSCHSYAHVRGRAGPMGKASHQTCFIFFKHFSFKNERHSSALLSVYLLFSRNSKKTWAIQHFGRRTWKFITTILPLGFDPEPVLTISRPTIMYVPKIRLPCHSRSSKWPSPSACIPRLSQVTFISHRIISFNATQSS